MICYVNKDFETTVHKAKQKDIEWSDGIKRTAWVPACGTRTDVAALEYGQDETGFITCERCLKRYDEFGGLR